MADSDKVYNLCEEMHRKVREQGLIKPKKNFKATLSVTISGTCNDDDEFNPRYVVDELNELIKKHLNEKPNVAAKVFTAIKRVYL